MTNPYAPPLTKVGDRAPGEGAITEEMISALRGTKGWVLLIGILLFIVAIFMGLGGVFMMFGSAMMGAAGVKGGAPAGVFIGVGAVYLLMTAIYVFLGIYLVKYSSAISKLIASGQSADMEAALEQQRKFWRLAGVLALIGIVLMVVGMIAAIAIPVLLGARMGK
jgi:hypothetical protein